MSFWAECLQLLKIVFWKKGKTQILLLFRQRSQPTFPPAGFCATIHWNPHKFIAIQNAYFDKRYPPGRTSDQTYSPIIGSGLWWGCSDEGTHRWSVAKGTGCLPKCALHLLLWPSAKPCHTAGEHHTSPGLTICSFSWGTTCRTQSLRPSVFSRFLSPHQWNLKNLRNT